MSGPIGTAVASGGRCATCDVELAGPFRHRCGEPGPHEADLAVRHLLHDAVHDLTHLDTKIWRTIRALVPEPVRPVFILIPVVYILAIVVGVTWADGHWR